MTLYQVPIKMLGECQIFGKKIKTKFHHTEIVKD
jgi:hypothetical protein